MGSLCPLSKPQELRVTDEHPRRGRAEFRRLGARGVVGLALLVLVPVAPSPQARAAVTLGADFSVVEIYTDNILFSDRDKRDDFVTLLAPSLTLGYESKNLVIRGTYTGAAQLFANNPDQNAFAQVSDFFIDIPGLTQRYRGLEVQLLWSFNFSPQAEAFSFGGEPGEQPILGQRLATGAGLQAIGVGEIFGQFAPTLSNQGIFTRRSDAFQHLAGFRASYRWTPLLSSTLSYRNRLQFFSSEEFQDSVTHEADVGLQYDWLRRTRVGVTYGLKATEFRGGTGQTGNNFFSHSFTVGTTHQFSRTTAIQANVGGLLVEREREGGQSEFSGNLRFENEYPKGRLSLRFGQFIGSGGGLAAEATLSQSFVGTIDHTFTRRLSAFLLGGLARNESLTSGDIDILTYQSVTGLRVALLSWLDANASYSYIKQDSSGLVGEKTQRNMVFLGLRAHALPWKLLD